MIINSDINILGGLPDLNLISVFFNNTIESLDNEGGHRSYTSIKTDKSVKRFEKAITRTLLYFRNEEIEQIFRSIISTESLSNDCLFFVFLNASLNNDLLNYLNSTIYFPALYSGRISIKTPEVIACLMELRSEQKEMQNWSDSTLETTASKYLTFLKKFNLMEGTLNKSITHAYLNDKMFVIFIYWLLSVELKPNILESNWLQYCFLEKHLFIDRVMQKKFSKYFNLNFNGEKMKIEPIISYQDIYYELTKFGTDY